MRSNSLSGTIPASYNYMPLSVRPPSSRVHGSLGMRHCVLAGRHQPVTTVSSGNFCQI